MNIYFIRHAATSANLNGEIVKNYNSYSILPFDKDEWWKKVGVNLPKEFKVISSPAKRCIETTEALFGKDYKVTDYLKEFDCSFLGDNKFWEISKEEFDKLSNISEKEVEEKISKLLIELHAIFDDTDNVVCVTHGLFTRTVYSFFDSLCGGYMDSLYDLLNSKNFEFKNLDMLEIKKLQIQNVWRFNNERV